MNPEIKRYLDEHGATYTADALRQRLLEAGHDAAAVDSALRDWEAQRSGGSRPEDRRTFGRWALGLHIGALVGMLALVLLLRGTTAIGIALLGAGVLGVALLIGWAISSLIGRALLPRTGTTIALIVPAISALALGGSCLAIMVSAIQPPPRDGTVHLQVLAPRAFDGSGPAACYLQDQGGIQVNSQELGTLDGNSVSVYFYWYGSDPNVPQPVDSTYVSIILNPGSETEPPETYATIFSTRLEIDAAADNRSGSIQFDGLAPDSEGAPGEAIREPISGSVSWACE